MTVRTKRIYDHTRADDGFRVLVDRLWPRGISKEDASIDLWLKEVAPSNELRKWFGHRPERFTVFAEKYAVELESNPAVDELRAVVGAHDIVTLLYGAKDETHNQASVLADYLGR